MVADYEQAVADGCEVVAFSLVEFTVTVGEVWLAASVRNTAAARVWLAPAETSAPPPPAPMAVTPSGRATSEAREEPRKMKADAPSAAYGVLGSANIARQFTRGLAGSTQAQVVCVGSRNAEKATAFAAE